MAAPIIGTGQTVFAQAGYKFKDGLLKGNGTLQPYVSAQISQFDKLHEPMVLLDGGLNWFVHGTHNGKITLNYQSRPVFDQNAAGEWTQTSRKGMVVMQYQISL